MSKLHKRIKAHENMSLKEKEVCNCEMCKGLNVNKKYRKIETPTQKFEDVFKDTTQNSNKEIITPNDLHE